MIYVLLPAYNEADAIPRLFPALAEVFKNEGFEYRIVICNDGSSDATQSVIERHAESMPVDVLTHRINRGLGETMRDLFEYVAEVAEPDDILVRLDCDDTHNPEVIPLFLEKLTEGIDVVIASRFVDGGGQVGVSRYRAFISYGANIFMKIFFPIRGIKEYSCGYRAYRASLIKRAIEVYGNNFIQLRGLGFTCTLEKLVKLKLLKARFGEVPFVLRYDKKLGLSKMVSSITTFGYLVMVVLYHWPFGGWRVSYPVASPTPAALTPDTPTFVPDGQERAASEKPSLSDKR